MDKTQMKILFLTLLDFDSLEEKSIYTDLLREFAKNGHDLYIISPVERRKKGETRLVIEDNATILKLKIGNTQKTNIIEKGISTILIEPLFIKAIKKYFSNVKFELVMYSTPPITFCKAIEYVKKRDGAKTYLLLKDIFPQNAVDIGMLSTSGLKGIIYKFFRNKEKKLYGISDHIGCMSQANVDYIIQHNSEIDERKVSVCPNSIDAEDKSISTEERNKIRNEYGIPTDKKVFVYGGNLGKPQGIDFLIQCLRSQSTDTEAFFFIVGDGTEYDKLEAYVTEENANHVMLQRHLPRVDYEAMVGACDIGMIFLDHRFTIPNFPSRLLSYMQAQLPVLAVTDINTDIGQEITEGGFGWWCESNDVKKFRETVQEILDADLASMKQKETEYLLKHYTVQQGYMRIMSSIGRN